MKKKSQKFIDLCVSYGVDPTVIPEVTSFEKACKELRLNPAALPEVYHLPERFQKSQVADYKLGVIADAIRGGKPIDGNKPTYEAWFDFEVDETGSVVGLSYDDYVAWCSRSAVGVRFCFNEPDQAIFFGKHFIDLHKDHKLNR